MASDKTLRTPSSESGNDERDLRASSNREVTENRELTDEERLALLQNANFSTVLPDPPKLEGFHLIWLSTTNQQDPIHARIRLGYEPVKAEEIPAFKFSSLKSGEWMGCVGVNEMVLFKLPMRLYQAYMKHMFHDAPLGEEGKLKANVDALKEQVRRIGASIDAEEGIEQLAAKMKAPVF